MLTLFGRATGKAVREMPRDDDIISFFNNIGGVRTIAFEALIGSED
jgi:hypothetical protein